MKQLLLTLLGASAFSFSDSTYFLCLGVVAITAIVGPVCFWLLTMDPSRGGATAFVLGTSVALGALCSLPFASTHELPWLPYIAVPYFIGGGLGCAFWGVFRRD